MRVCYDGAEWTFSKCISQTLVGIAEALRWMYKSEGKYFHVLATRHRVWTVNLIY